MRDEFLDYLQFEKRYSPHTIISYRRDLDDFYSFYLKTESSEDLLKADKKNIRNFVVELSESGISKRTVNRKLSTLRSFYLFLLKLGEIEVSPVESISSLKFYPEKQIPISQDEMEVLQDEIFSNVEDLLENLLSKSYIKQELGNLNFVA